MKETRNEQPKKALNQAFKNVMSYAAGIQTWVNGLFEQGGHKMEYSFAQDYAIADWISGQAGVRETMGRVRREWQSNWKAYAQAVAQLKAMTDVNYQLEHQGISGREKWMEFYDDLFCEERDHFFEDYADNDDAKAYLFELCD